MAHSITQARNFSKILFIQHCRKNAKNPCMSGICCNRFLSCYGRMADLKMIFFSGTCFTTTCQSTYQRRIICTFCLSNFRKSNATAELKTFKVTSNDQSLSATSWENHPTQANVQYQYWGHPRGSNFCHWMNLYLSWRMTVAKNTRVCEIMLDRLCYSFIIA